MRAASKNSVTGRLVDAYNAENSDNVVIEFEVFGRELQECYTNGTGGKEAS